MLIRHLQALLQTVGGNGAAQFLHMILSLGAVWLRWGHKRRCKSILWQPLTWSVATQPELCQAEPVPPDSTGVMHVYKCTCINAPHVAVAIFTVCVCVWVRMCVRHTQDEGWRPLSCSSLLRCCFCTSLNILCRYFISNPFSLPPEPLWHQTDSRELCLTIRKELQWGREIRVFQVTSKR